MTKFLRNSGPQKLFSKLTLLQIIMSKVVINLFSHISTVRWNIFKENLFSEQRRGRFNTWIIEQPSTFSDFNIPDSCCSSSNRNREFMHLIIISKISFGDNISPRNYSINKFGVTCFDYSLVLKFHGPQNFWFSLSKHLSRPTSN